ncbi:MAG: bifunctional riboflavin kinase/FAD synthetase [Rhodospirillales bacterium]
MRLIRHARATPADAKGAVIAAGNFDGVHLGHQAVIARVRDLAREAGRASAVMTFEPHPRALFTPDAPPFRLTPFALKARLIQALGVDTLFSLPFTRALAGLSAEAFIEQILAAGAGCAHIVVGADFHFGKGRAGDVETLRREGARRGFSVTALQQVTDSGGEAHSSTAVRAHLTAGNPAAAAAALGRAHELCAHAHGLPGGGLMLRPRGVHPPAPGVYKVRVGPAPVSAGTAGTDATLELRHAPDAQGRPACEVLIRPFESGPDLAGRSVRAALIERTGDCPG